MPSTIGALVESLRRRATGLSLPARHAAVLQSLPLGPGSRLIVVEFAGKRLLVGQSRAGLSLLGEAAPESPVA
ncbi:flagellar biosynthetic protein FliO [Sandarakinorhabdus sp.]|uniref:flagellar biosynthetic protein FliO n=1 Tax=Sandarakinorhabdus sp. TaxID=1916663 RepID=UPI00286EAC3B|nr:flagellar biosynthetic protein FliO [Sandarakinorhabdus sp.]